MKRKLFKTLVATAIMTFAVSCIAFAIASAPANITYKLSIKLDDGTFKDITASTPTNKHVFIRATTDKGYNNNAFVDTKTITKVIEVAANGTYKLEVRDFGGTGAKITAKEVKITNIDTTLPTITVVKWSNWDESKNFLPTGGNVTVTVECKDGKLNASAHTFYTNGDYTFTAKDAAGNVNTLKVSTDMIDKNLPVVTYPGSNGDKTAMAYLTTPTRNDYNIDFTCSNGVIYSYKFKNIKSELTEVKDLTSGSLSYRVTQNGSLIVYARTPAGKTSQTVVIIKNVDKVKPILKVSYTGKGVTTPAKVKYLILSALSNEGTVTVTSPAKEAGQMDIKTESPRPTNLKVTTETNGTYTFKAVDAAGNETIVAETIDFINSQYPTISVAGYAPVGVVNGVEVFKAVDKTPVNTKVTVTATATNGMFSNPGADKTPTQSYTFVSNASHTFVAVSNSGKMKKIVVVCDTIDTRKPSLTAKLYEVDPTAGQIPYDMGPTNRTVRIVLTTDETTAAYSLKSSELIDDEQKASPGPSTTGSGTNNMTIDTQRNGVYTIQLKDLAGNITEKVITLKNIDTVAPHLVVWYSTNETTDRDVIAYAACVQVDAAGNPIKIADGYVDKYGITHQPQYKVDTTARFVQQSSHTFRENGDFTFEAVDNAGNVSTINASVTWIVKE